MQDTLRSKFNELEKSVCRMIETAGSGHYASSMSALEIMVPLFYVQGIKPDQFILSKGHAAPALYAVLLDLGYINEIAVSRFRQHGGLPGHPELTVNGVLTSSGSLGMGISKALGLAFANPDKVYHVLAGDGELQEGQNWEAILYMEARDIKNVIIHVDRNQYQYSGALQTSKLSAAEYPFMRHHQTAWLRNNSHLTTPKGQDLTYPAHLIEHMASDDRIVVLNADLEQDFNLTPIKENFPSRYIQCGISEQHMVSMANGLALAGKIPICHTFSAFYRRAIDQMYNNACDHLSIGYVAGLTKKTATNIGASHAPTDPAIFSRIGVLLAGSIAYFFKRLPECGGIYLEVS